MKEFLSSGVVGNIEYNAQKQIRESIQNRWEQLGFTSLAVRFGGAPDSLVYGICTGNAVYSVVKLQRRGKENLSFY